MSLVICARVQTCRRRLCQHKLPHIETALCMLKRDLGGKLSYRGLSSPKCNGQDCIALDSIVAIKGEQNLPERSIIGEELQEEMRAWQQLSVESLLQVQRDLILEQQVVIVTEERPA